MTPETRIARHHLGDRLHWIGRGGPHADLWIVQAWPDQGHMLSAQGATVAEAAADCAAQLRAAGWVPTHARLEWQRHQGGCELRLCLDAHSQVLFTAEEHYKPDRYNLSADHNGDEEVLWECPAAEVFAFIAEWCATALPSLHLPPFPGDKP